MTILNLIQELSSQIWVQKLLQHADMHIVGGCVRDTLMNKMVKDIDILVEGKSLEFVKNLLRTFGRVDVVGESFSVLKFRPKGHKGEDFDIAVPRVDRKIGKGHKGFETITGVSVIEDLKRRDFTINSIAVNLKNGKIVDPFNGIEDLKSRLLRATDKNAFIEDPLRILRGIQFAARFRFDIEPGTLSLMKSNALSINEISGERILDEFNKILNKGGSTRIAFELIHKSGIDQALFGQSFNENYLLHLDNLDPISFYYILGTMGNTDPSEFYSKKIRGEAHITKALATIEKYFKILSTETDERELRWNVFMMLKSSPLIRNTRILPKKVMSIFKKMENDEIPSKFGDIPITGDDLMEMFDLAPGEELGRLIMHIYKDALMNKFDWKNREKVIEYLQNI